VALGATFVAFGVSTATGASFAALDRLGLPASLRAAGGAIAVAGGAGMLVGLGFPEAAIAGAALIALSIAAYLIAAIAAGGDRLGRIIPALPLLVLASLVALAHWPRTPLLPWLAS
jgi:hypothetical protein